MSINEEFLRNRAVVNNALIHSVVKDFCENGLDEQEIKDLYDSLFGNERNQKKRKHKRGVL